MTLTKQPLVEFPLMDTVSIRGACLPGSNGTGPLYLVHGGCGENVWEIVDTWDDLEFQGPSFSISPTLAVCMVVLLGVLAVALVIRRG